MQHFPVGLKALKRSRVGLVTAEQKAKHRALGSPEVQAVHWLHTQDAGCAQPRSQGLGGGKVFSYKGSLLRTKIKKGAGLPCKASILSGQHLAENVCKTRLTQGGSGSESMTVATASAWMAPQTFPWAESMVWVPPRVHGCANPKPQEGRLRPGKQRCNTSDI